MRGEEQGEARWTRLVILAWVYCLLQVAPLSIAAALSYKLPRIAIYFLVAQDLPVLALASIVLALVALPVASLPASAAMRIAELARRRGAAVCAGLCAGVAMLAFAGWFTVYHQYPLSMDEFWEAFDAKVFQRGVLLAGVAPPWRAYVPALQPIFGIDLPGHTHWGSFYLPVNSALLALAGLLGSQALAEPLAAALSVAAVFALGRRYWPHRPDAALAAALMMATSAQLVVTAMTPYAMTAQLALNLAWLWLFQRKDAPSQAGAVIAAFLATGAHQVIFHPLFAAPFVLQLWLQRRIAPAALWTVAYAAICLVWASYFGLVLRVQGIAGGGAAGQGLAGFVHRSVWLVSQFQLADPALMAVNLIRFITWQNPLAVALGAVGMALAVRERHEATWPLAAGFALTGAAMLAVMPFQGHGWGYRYLHGLLGSLCLLAAFAWVRLVDPASATSRRAWAGLGLASAFSVLVALPIRAGQADVFIGPYASALRAIERASADLVIVDSSGLWYGLDLIRNDPFLTNAPTVMDIDALSEDQVRTLCATRKIAVFDQRSPAASAITHVDDDGSYPRAVALRAQMRKLGCGTPLS